MCFTVFQTFEETASNILATFAAFKSLTTSHQCYYDSFSLWINTFSRVNNILNFPVPKNWASQQRFFLYPNRFLKKRVFLWFRFLYGITYALIRIKNSHFNYVVWKYPKQTITQFIIKMYIHLIFHFISYCLSVRNYVCIYTKSSSYEHCAFWNPVSNTNLFVSRDFFKRNLKCRTFCVEVQQLKEQTINRICLNSSYCID